MSTPPISSVGKPSKPSILVRSATIDELPLLQAFEQQIIEAERPYDDDIKTKTSYYDLGALIESDQSQVLVAEVNGELVGSGYAKIRPSKHYLEHERHSYLGFMYVKPEYRGRGVIQKIIAELAAWSKAQGLSDIFLEVYADNKKALKAYEKSGFKQALLEMKMRI